MGTREAGGTQGGRPGATAGSVDPPALQRGDWGQTPANSRADAAARAVARIASGVAPGTRLGTKEELRAHCGVSVGTFNEALRLLLSRGLVTVRPGPGGGLFAIEQTPMVRLGHSILALDGLQADADDALRIRDALEPLLWQDALWHASPADVRDLRVLLKEMDGAGQAGDMDAFARSHRQLHKCVADITPNALLRSLYVNLQDLVEGHAVEVLPPHGSPAEYLRARHRLHADLVDALDKRDAAALLRCVAECDPPGAGSGESA
ncbi:FadR/GntR family transcriptional regulator [Streptomyces sp. NBC_00878]|uniref:FadR/GntR family transcriptional regulator n=1 Tax=Streptomyces sp. NBC_00878 TaxID=2975854 RepID=UPI0022505E39|nr:FCD domain-containing protein [Streptomyces sp. NBC_00878]MCX4904658.1 FCD domain-containing protein [Streptomyces sp. NBC_00878]